MLFLETSVPNKPANLRLLKGGETSIEVAWNPVKTTDRYLVQICPMGVVDKKKKVEPKKSDPSKEPPKKPQTESSPKVTPTKETPKDETDASKNSKNEENKKIEEASKTTIEEPKKTNEEKPTEKTAATNPDQLKPAPSGETADPKNEENLKNDHNNKINEKTEDKMEIDKKQETDKEDKMDVDPAPKSSDNENDVKKTEDKLPKETPESKLEDTKMDLKEDKTDEDMKIAPTDKSEKKPEVDQKDPKETDKSTASSDKEQKLVQKGPVQLPMLPGMPLPGMKPIITPSVIDADKNKDIEKAPVPSTPSVPPPPADGDKTPTRDEEEDKDKEVEDKKPLKDTENKEKTESDIQKENSEKTDTEPKKEPIETKSGEEKSKSDESATELKSEPKTEPEKTESNQEKKTEKEPEKEPEKKSPAEKVPEKIPEKTQEKVPEKEKKSDDPSWFDVALTQSTRHEIKSYFVEADKDDSGLASDEVLFLDSDKHWKKQTLGTKQTNPNLHPPLIQPLTVILGSGITYRVRICAINACGRSIFSDHSAYKTIVPGFPRAPTSIKVSKTDDGASLSWSPPVNTEIIEYSVYLGTFLFTDKTFWIIDFNVKTIF